MDSCLAPAGAARGLSACLSIEVERDASLATAIAFSERRFGEVSRMGQSADESRRVGLSGLHTTPV